MEITDPKAQAYIDSFTSAGDELLRELEEFTLARHPKAHMISGHLQGRLLSMISHMIKPDRILEIGTFTGFSALCLAEGLSSNGVLHTIELREEDAAIAEQFFKRSPLEKKINLHIGNAVDIIGELDESWDLVFIDADKAGYVNYFNLVFPKLRPNGFILADNVLFHGQVLDAEIKGKNAKAIQAFNEYIASREDIEKVMMPVRDGIYLIRKLY